MADDVRAALLLHLRQCGFVDPDDGTVATFPSADTVQPVVWTSAERLADAVLARFELRDRQRDADGLTIRVTDDGDFTGRCHRCTWSVTDSSAPGAAGNWAVNHVCPQDRAGGGR